MNENFWSLKTFALLAVPYSCAVAALFLKAYWNPLGINAFQFANLADLVSAAIATLWASAIFAFAGLGAGLLNNRRMFGTEETSDAGPAADRSERIHVYMVTVLAALLVIAAIALYMKGIPEALTFGALGAVMLLPAVLKKTPGFRALFPSLPKAFFGVVVLFFIPLFAFAVGWRDGNIATSVALGLHVDVARSELSVSTTEPVLYVGMLGRYHILWEASSASTIIVPAEKQIVISSARKVLAAKK